MILPLESRDLSLLDICPVGATSLFASFPIEVFGDHHPLGLLRYTEQTVHCSTPANALARLRLHVNTTLAAPLKEYQHVELTAHCSLLRMYPSHVEEKVSMLHGAKFRSP